MPVLKARRWVNAAAFVALAAGSPVLRAQEVVQPLPPAGSAELSSALQRLAANGSDLSALLDAGDAAIKLGDVAAAIGFFGRAQALTAANPRISVGLARAYTMSRRPVEALRLYAEAEKLGVAKEAMSSDWALAFDLVGDARTAQELYRVALAAGAGDEVRRNLALSQAISGDKQGFEATLLPLLRRGDSAAFRTRAFGLAILGETEAAIKIARDMMPTATAARVEPYLRYMQRLTPAQQAAAGTLGVFPRTASIGRDDVEIAGYSTSGDRSVRNVGAELAPSGMPLGSDRTTRVVSRKSDQGVRTNERIANSRFINPAPAPIRAEGPSEPSAVSRTAESPAADRSAATMPVVIGTQPARPAPPPPPPVAQSSPTVTGPQQDLAAAFADFDLTSSPSSAPRPGAVDIRSIDVPREIEEHDLPPQPARHWVQIATGRDLAALAYDWRRIGKDAGGELAGKNAFTIPIAEANRLLAGPYDSVGAARIVVTRLKAIGVDSFAFSSSEGEAVYALDGAKPAPKAEKPALPARHWVQVATGRDRNALGFDWRRIERKADGELDAKGPFVTPWGEANRLLAGPYDSPAAARQAMNRLKELGIDSFLFTSEPGEAIDKLD